MSETTEARKNAFDPLKMLRELRDAGLDAWAKAALGVTSSRPYAELNAAISRPAMLAAALFRKSSDAAMAQLLAQLNMPSREEVLSLSRRLTRIEMVLDDLGAAMDAMRDSSARPQRPAERATNGDGAPLRDTAKEG